MRIISRRRLREFWEADPQARSPLTHWYRVTRLAHWGTLAELRQTFPMTDLVDAKFLVFNIGGNNYRLIVVIHWGGGERVYIRHVLSHQDYDRGAWKDG